MTTLKKAVMMPKYYFLKKIFFFSFFFFSLGYSIHADPNQLGWLTFGDLRGHIEPCGCSPSSDYGGIFRLTEFLARERAQNPQLFLFSTGNHFSSSPRLEPIVDEYILQGLEGLKLNASLFNLAEFYYWQRKGQLGQVPFVLSNPLKEIKLPNLAFSISWPGIRVFGLVSSGPFSTKISDEVLNKIKNEIKSDEVSLLLFSGPDSELEKIKAVGIFKFVISSQNKPLEDEFVVGNIEKNPEAIFIRTGGGYQSPLGATGVLRGGSLKFNKSQNMDQLFGASSKTITAKAPAATNLGNAVFGQEVSWLDTSYDTQPQGQTLKLAYEKARKGEQQSWEIIRGKNLKNSPFVGPESCKACHQKEYDIWSHSAHGHAFATLETKHKDTDLSCVSCHVTGFNDAGGFASSSLSPHLKNVTCENCHGPRKSHTENPTLNNTKSNPANLGLCVACHHSPHSTAFDKDKYWDKMKHGKGRAPERK